MSVVGNPFWSQRRLGSHLGIQRPVRLDSISTGAAVAFAMELYERGILKKHDVNDLDLRFGNEDAYVQMPEVIAYRKGMGNLLAEGTRTASAKIGQQSDTLLRSKAWTTQDMILEAL